MARIYVIGEDALCCALGTRLATDFPGCELAQPAIDTRGVTRLRKSISRYVGLTNMHPVLCIADTDGRCAAELHESWLPSHTPAGFLLRLAVTESESWLLADRNGFAKFFKIAPARIPLQPDNITDAKRAVLNLAVRSKGRYLRQEVVSAHDKSKPGTGYNTHLCNFVMQQWNPREAANSSPSLARAMRRLKELFDAQCRDKS